MGVGPASDSAPPGGPGDSEQVIYLPPNRRLALREHRFRRWPLLPVARLLLADRTSIEIPLYPSRPLCSEPAALFSGVQGGGPDMLCRNQVEL